VPDLLRAAASAAMRSRAKQRTHPSRPVPPRSSGAPLIKAACRVVKSAQTSFSHWKSLQARGRRSNMDKFVRAQTLNDTGSF